MRFLFLAALFMAFNVSAQKAKVTNAWNYMNSGEFDKAYENIEQASKDASTSEDAKTWYYRGKILVEAMQNEKYKNITDNMPQKAFNSFIKAQKLDDRGKYSRELDQFLGNMAFSLFNAGTTVLQSAEDEKNEELFMQAHEIFESFITCMESLSPQMRQQVSQSFAQNDINTNVAFYYSGYCALKAGKDDMARKRLEYLAGLNFDDWRVYYFLANMYYDEVEKDGDADKALNILEKGSAFDSEDNFLMKKRLSIYQSEERMDEFVKSLQEAVEKEPDNADLWVALGGTYQQIANSYQNDDNDETNNEDPEQYKEFSKKAESAYAKALELEPTNPDVNYNIGIIYYNEGVSTLKAANELDDWKKAGEMEETAIEQFKVALPYFEAACENSECNDENLVSIMYNIYSRAKMTEKATEYRAKLEKIKGE